MSSSESASSKLTTVPSHYDVLQISHNATQEVIKTAYRDLVRGSHPDKLLTSSSIPQNNSDDHIQQCSEGLSAIDIDDNDEEDADTESSHVVSENDNHSSLPTKCETDKNSNEDEASIEMTKFHQIQAAYHCLRDPHKRRQYDESISRNEERKEWKWKGAAEVNLSEMEFDMCCVVDEDDSDEESGTDESPLQKVFFHPCRCGDTFQIVHEELLESIDDKNSDSVDNCEQLTNRVWRCESCSLMIRINVDIPIE